MSAITISRQMGSRGDELAQQVAEQLNWRCVGYELINQAALAAGAPHVALAEIDELGFFNLEPTIEERQAYQSQVERIVQELAGEGQVVIMGRGGQAILHNQPNVVHLRVVAPRSVYSAKTNPGFDYNEGVRFAALPAIMQAKRKPLETNTLAELVGDAACTTKYTRFEAPPQRAAGVMVTSVAELVDKLATEAKVL